MTVVLKGFPDENNLKLSLIIFSYYLIVRQNVTKSFIYVTIMFQLCYKLSVTQPKIDENLFFRLIMVPGTIS
ncbi:hypothetical protein GCM10010954_24330 [Halobacillus andaensis]|uniref:Uncharacterized protein n=1 Tax=Halobacillus andaensis TaxID=1176239 RepID=A0A917B851_HALAA|nr:hypothetical protein GCM10010954_24330 [Halobacillus andaensis]